MSSTFTVRGQKVRSQSNRRFIVVAVRPEAITNENGTYVAFARIVKRSDNVDTARTSARRWTADHRAAARRYGSADDFAVVVDSTTGQEI